MSLQTFLLQCLHSAHFIEVQSSIFMSYMPQLKTNGKRNGTTLNFIGTPKGNTGYLEPGTDCSLQNTILAILQHWYAPALSFYGEPPPSLLQGRPAAPIKIEKDLSDEERSFFIEWIKFLALYYDFICQLIFAR